MQDPDLTLINSSSEDEALSINRSDTHSYHHIKVRTLNSSEIEPGPFKSPVDGCAWAALNDPDSHEVDALLMDHGSQTKSSIVLAKTRTLTSVRARTEGLPRGFRMASQLHRSQLEDAPTQSTL